MENQQLHDLICSATLFADQMKALGYHLDFSLKSLFEEIEVIFESTIFSNHDNHAQWVDEAGLEAYIGETLCRLFDGKWQGEFRHDNPGVNFYKSFVLFGKFELYPSHFIAYRINNGRQDTGTFTEYLERILPLIKQREASP
jgi:hypothetical protein